MTNRDDVREAIRLGADMVGFVFYRRSTRFIRVEDAKAIIDELPRRVKKVGVFVNEGKRTVSGIARRLGLDAVQLHGDESARYCSSVRGPFKVVKAFRIRKRRDLGKVNSYDVDFYLLDSYRNGERGGTGKTFPWAILKGFEFRRPVILSGGLTPGNVCEAIKSASPYAVDVASGVERYPGKKDPRLMKKFIAGARKRRGP